MDIIIVCHTEFGFVRNKRIIFDKKAVSGVRNGVLNLIKTAEKYGAKTTFAVVPEVAGYFPKNAKHEIGLHIHPGWQEFKEFGFKFNIGDKYLRENCKQATYSTVLRDYSYGEQFDMIKTGKDYLNKAFGYNPTSFVAGRWSLNNDTIRVLIETGFTHDCSAPAHSKPSHHDWSKLPRICMPYHPNKDDYQKKGDLSMLIVPISQFFPIGSVNVESVPFYGISWLRACFLEYYKQNVPLFHICLHSPSMTDNYFISAMDDLLSFISKHKDINFKFALEIKEYPEKNFRTNIFPYIFGLNAEIIKTAIFR
ncbi:MAG: hypothetical protein CEN87_192 [Parcubacteria group bacterium Licking1014_1]|nr:MAG: hypothetical protein CEN87_192 [Parcubacteria group bacterium Licking1014_1]